MEFLSLLKADMEYRMDTVHGHDHHDPIHLLMAVRIQWTNYGKKYGMRYRLQCVDFSGSRDGIAEMIGITERVTGTGTVETEATTITIDIILHIAINARDMPM